MEMIVHYREQPHMPYGNEKDDCPVVPRIPYRLYSTPEVEAMCRISLAIDSRTDARICQIDHPKIPFRVYNLGIQINAPRESACNTPKRRLANLLSSEDSIMANINPIIPSTEYKAADDPIVDFDTPAGRTPPVPRGQMVVRVEDADNVNVVFSPPIACVMRDPDGQDRPVCLTDSDDLIARIFAGWCMVGVV